MEKYYDLIVSMIKQHRKYEGCESITGDIVADVWEHAKVVASTINDDDVLKSYLEKIVATSMITVPKRMGITKRRTSNVEMPAITPLQEYSPEPVHAEPIQTEPVHAEPIQTEPIHAEPIKEDPLDITETGPCVNEVFEEPAEVELPPSEQENDSDDTVFEELSDEPEILPSTDSPDSTTEPKVDMELVDKLINGVDSHSEPLQDTCDDNDLEQEDVPEINEQTDDDSVPLAVQLGETIDELFVTEPDSIDETLVDLVEEPDESDSQELEEYEAPDEADEVNDTEDAETVKEVDETEDMPAESLQEDFIIAEDDKSDITEPLTNIDTEETLPLFDTDNDTEENIEPSAPIHSVEDFYKAFEYQPERIENKIDCDGIIEDLKSADKKYPDFKIMEVCKLKYNENLSVDEIASRLNLTDDAVLKCLDEIMSIVKG